MKAKFTRVKLEMRDAEEEREEVKQAANSIAVPRKCRDNSSVTIA